MNKDPFSLQDKTIIVTGASSGIGRECSVSCSRQGARVVLMGRDHNRLNETMALMQERNDHTICAVDLTNYEEVEKMISGLTPGFGKIDGLVNCAGISTTLPLNMVKPDKLGEFFSANVQAAVNLTRVVTRLSNFSEAGGSVIFIGSVMGEAGEAGKLIYSITKGALIAGARSLAIELAPRKIRVNSISPGVVETPMSKNAVYSRNEESLNRVINQHPLGLGLPEDVANACIYLLSDAARWITGTNLIVDGGYLAR